MFKVFLLQSLAWLYDPLISLLLQAIAQVSLFKYCNSFTVSRRINQY